MHKNKIERTSTIGRELVSIKCGIRILENTEFGF